MYKPCDEFTTADNYLVYRRNDYGNGEKRISTPAVITNEMARSVPPVGLYVPAATIFHHPSPPPPTPTANPCRHSPRRRRCCRPRPRRPHKSQRPNRSPRTRAAIPPPMWPTSELRIQIDQSSSETFRDIYSHVVFRIRRSSPSFNNLRQMISKQKPQRLLTPAAFVYYYLYYLSGSNPYPLGDAGAGRQDLRDVGVGDDRGTRIDGDPTMESDHQDTWEPTIRPGHGRLRDDAHPCQCRREAGDKKKAIIAALEGWEKEKRAGLGKWCQALS